MVLFHPVSCREKQSCRGGKHSAYAQTGLRHNTAEHRELRLPDTSEQRDPEYTDDNTVLLENDKKALAVTLKHPKRGFFLNETGKKKRKQEQSARQEGHWALCTLEQQEMKRLYMLLFCATGTAMKVQTAMDADGSLRNGDGWES